jgi:hypothetical protein
MPITRLAQRVGAVVRPEIGSAFGVGAYNVATQGADVGAVLDSVSRRKTIMQTLGIDCMGFCRAFGRDADFEDTSPQTTYLDRETGEVLWVFNADDDASDVGVTPEENEEIRLRIAAAPGRYLKLPGLGHHEHHGILQEFLDSDWTEDNDAKADALDAYHGSIGGWKAAARDTGAVEAYYDYRDAAVQKMVENFLRRNGIEPQWT